MNKFSDGISFQQTISLIHIGFREGHRKMKLNFDLTIEDVSDLLDSDPSVMQKAMEIFQKHVSNLT